MSVAGDSSRTILESPHRNSMVHANPTTGDGGGHGRGAFNTYPRLYHEPPPQLQGTQRVMSIPEKIVSVKIAGSEADAASEDVIKIRKPYTITKARESWTKEEHAKFLHAIQRFDRDWKKIEGFVGSKTTIQIRSHAQKHFLKVQKNGTTEHIPPPRLKRKAAHPYPQKASKNAQNMSQATSTDQKSSNLLEPRSIQPINASQLRTGYAGPAGTMMSNNYYRSSIGIPPCTWKNCETSDQVHQAPALFAMPDFAQIYSFIGNVFDPSTSDQLFKLKEMNPIDVETVLLLMRNLSINLASPDFEGLRRLLFFS